MYFYPVIIPIYSCSFSPVTSFYRNPLSNMSTQIRKQSPFPPVNIGKFETSARQFQKLMEQASRFVNKVVEDHQYAYKLMNTAQLSNQQRVEELIRSTGINIHFHIHFTPTSIQIILDNSDNQYNCCQLVMELRW
ncbi:hypothetical protein P5F77_06265 [Caldifermentibacillus hisashii]|uniref:hypothetical protein n=1 Tax=Caldifermentibacillus hisashii TaxID=996558 RepID=UPI0030D6C7CB